MIVREANGQRGGGRSGGRGTRRSGHGGRAFNRDSYDNQNTNGNNNGFTEGTDNLWRMDILRNLKDVVDTVPSEVTISMEIPQKVSAQGGCMSATVEPAAEMRLSVKVQVAETGDQLSMMPSHKETKEVDDTEKNIDSEKQEEVADTNKENTAKVAEVKEPEKEEMTLEEYEKVLKEKRKALVALKSEERKVALDKDLAKMQLLSSKKSEEEIFVKLLGTDKDKKKEAADKEEKAKKSVSIEEFLKLAGGERYNSGGRGRGRDRGSGGGYTGV